MAAQDFIDELRELGYDVSVSEPGPQLPGYLVARVPYQIPVGTKAGTKVTLGFVVPPDYPLVCMSGPYMTPYVMPLNNTSSEPPNGGILAADTHQPQAGFGDGWQYWSRPFNDWAQSGRNARAYLRHVAHLLDLI